LLGILQKADLPAQARIETGDDLAMLGDPRFDPYTWYLPRQPMFGFIEIPAGSFWMGTDEREVPAMLEQWGFGPDWVGQAQPIEIMQQWYKREIPQHCLYLDRFFIARYPVTVAQFSCFCKISGHEPDYPDCLEKPANHPVWNVSFRDALAYCHWLEESLQTSPKTPQPIAELLAKGWRLTIPSEAEWEKSARGDCTPPRLYPWGNDFDADKANLSETGLGKTSSVGCFPRGASPYGLLDLCGNVWEWTRSLWGNDPNQPEFGYPYQVEDGREQIVQDETLELRTLRGASCNNYQRYARCATRRAPIPVYHSSLRGFRLAIVR
jgi:formylglycine-generating enzyme required for sulfatase activity